MFSRTCIVWRGSVIGVGQGVDFGATYARRLGQLNCQYDLLETGKDGAERHAWCLGRAFGNRRPRWQHCTMDHATRADVIEVQSVDLLSRSIEQVCFLTNLPSFRVVT